MTVYINILTRADDSEGYLRDLKVFSFISNIITIVHEALFNLYSLPLPPPSSYTTISAPNNYGIMKSFSLCYWRKQSDTQ